MRVVRMVDAMPIGNTGQARRHWHTFRPCQRLSLGGGRQREMLSSFITPLGLYESEHKHVYIYARARTHTHSHTCRRAESETDVNNPETDVAADSSEAAMRLSPLSSSARGPAIFSDENRLPPNLQGRQLYLIKVTRSQAQSTVPVPVPVCLLSTDKN